jgi:hypothetical protein
MRFAGTAQGGRRPRMARSTSMIVLAKVSMIVRARLHWRPRLVRDDARGRRLTPGPVGARTSPLGHEASGWNSL